MQAGRPKSRGVGIDYKQTEQILHTRYTKYNSIFETLSLNLKPPLNYTLKFEFLFPLGFFIFSSF